MKVKVIILIFAVIFLAVGVYIGQHQDVMQKAIRVCLECIGVG